jgi:hypothetical protein
MNCHIPVRYSNWENAPGMGGRYPWMTKRLGQQLGKLEIIWGDDSDSFNPVSQVREFTISMELTSSDDDGSGGDDNDDKLSSLANGMQSADDIVPMSIFTSQEIDALASCAGFELVAQYGALSSDEEDGVVVDIQDEDLAYRMVLKLRKPPL